MKAFTFVLLMVFTNPLFSQLDTLYDQMSPLQESPNGTFAYIAGVQNDSLRFVAADDFEVPSGETWEVNNIRVQGRGFTLSVDCPGTSNDPLIETFIVDIYSHDEVNCFPNELLYSDTVNLDTPYQSNGSIMPEGNDPLIPIPTKTLMQGTYWVSIIGIGCDNNARLSWRMETYLNDSPLGCGIAVYESDSSFWYTSTTFGNTVTNTNLYFQILGGTLVNTKDTRFENEIEVFPNPCSDYLVIPSYEAFDYIELYNNTSQIVGEFSSKERIDLPDLPNGIYYLVLKGGDTMRIAKVVISN